MCEGVIGETLGGGHSGSFCASARTRYGGLPTLISRHFDLLVMAKEHQKSNVLIQYFIKLLLFSCIVLYLMKICVVLHTETHCLTCAALFLEFLLERKKRFIDES